MTTNGGVHLKYYKISQYEKMSNFIKIPSITTEEAETAYGLVKHVENPKNNILLNFYTSPLPIVSDKLKGVLEPYLPEVIGIPLTLASMSFDIGKVFWLLKLDSIPCEQTGARIHFNLDDIDDKKIFKTKTGQREHVIVDFDIVELILRSSIVDFEFSEVSVT